MVEMEKQVEEETGRRTYLVVFVRHGFYLLPHLSSPVSSAIYSIPMCLPPPPPPPSLALFEPTFSPSPSLAFRVIHNNCPLLLRVLIELRLLPSPPVALPPVDGEECFLTAHGGAGREPITVHQSTAPAGEFTDFLLAR